MIKKVGFRGLYFNNKMVIHMDNELAIKELEILQRVIERQEEIRLQIRKWYIAIITALTIAFLSNEITFCKCNYVLITFIITVSFLWLEVVHRVAEQRAMNRSGIVEKQLRLGNAYDGPKINDSLSKNNNPNEQWKALNNIRIYGIYVIYYLIIVILSFIT